MHPELVLIDASTWRWHPDLARTLANGITPTPKDLEFPDAPAVLIEYYEEIVKHADIDRAIHINREIAYRRAERAQIMESAQRNQEVGPTNQQRVYQPSPVLPLADRRTPPSPKPKSILTQGAIQFKPTADSAPTWALIIP